MYRALAKLNAKCTAINTYRQRLLSSAYFKQLPMAPTFHWKSLLIGMSLIAVSPATPAQVQMIFLVRHCEKALDVAHDPGLTAAGIASAERLAELLQQTGIEDIYTTDTRRTRATIEPMMTKTGLTYKLYDMTDHSFARLLKTSGKNILVAGHSNNIPMLLNELTDSQRYQPNDEYNVLWLVVLPAGGYPSVTQFRF